MFPYFVFSFVCDYFFFFLSIFAASSHSVQVRARRQDVADEEWYLVQWYNTYHEH